MPPEERRADAERSRHALLDAFVALIGERGEDVPMYEIARRAGVGQGTLYRHFPNRSDLAAALFERINDELEATAADHRDDPRQLDALLAAVASNQARMHSLSVALWSRQAAKPAVDHLVARTRALFEEPLQRAQEAGHVRADVTTTDLLAVTAMIEGVLMGVTDPQERDLATRKALDLVWRGLMHADAHAST